MPYLTLDRARRAAEEASFRSRTAANVELKRAATASLGSTFDIFLCHSFMDAQVVAGVYELLRAEGFSVYVDWIEDPQADRNRVNSETAEMLRMRMRNSQSLVYASSTNATSSRWMPWELGYFDGHRPNHVAVLPLVQNANDEFDGQEYLGLYPLLQAIPVKDMNHIIFMFMHGGRLPLGRFIQQGRT